MCEAFASGCGFENGEYGNPDYAYAINTGLLRGEAGADKLRCAFWMFCGAQNESFPCVILV